MPSKESTVLGELYASMKERMMARPDMSIDDQRALLELLHEPASEPTGVTYENVQCPGSRRPAIWCKPTSQSAASSVILYFHGGGGMAGSPSSHRKLAGHLAKAANSFVLLPDYSLAPEQPFPAGVDDAVAAYKWLVHAKGYRPSQLGVAGDSAGGNIATALGLKLKELKIQLPVGIAAFSPWLDMECLGESLVANEKTEALNPPGVLHVIAKMYAGEDLKNPFANSLHGDFSGYPPLFISAGGYEALLSDSTRLADRAKRAGTDVTLEVAPEMQHVYQFMAGTAPEADKTITDVGNWFKKKFGKQ